MTPARLLVVDDDRPNTSFLKRLLVREGYDVTVANDGEAALQILSADRGFDTVLMDRRMPGVDGLEVLRFMKRTEGLREIPVIFETALDGQADIWEGLGAGALYYLIKPLDPKLVVQVVAAATAECAEKRKLWAELEGTRSALALIQRGSFRYRGMQQCHDLTALLANCCPDPRRSVTGLSELMINALEHGNLGITYDEKSALIAARGLAAEIARREQLPENAAKWVTVQVARTRGRIRFKIQDMGPGFDFSEFQELKPERMYDSHGRGILLARWEAFDRVQYLGTGNCVVAEIDQP